MVSLEDCVDELREQRTLKVMLDLVIYELICISRISTIGSRMRSNTRSDKHIVDPQVIEQ